MAQTIPLSILRDSLTLERYGGTTGAEGASFGTSETVRAHVEPRRRLIVMPGGKEAHSVMFAVIPPSVAEPPVESRVTHNGRTFRVLETFRVPGPGGGVHHIELALA